MGYEMRLVFVQAMLGNELGKKGAIDAPCDIMACGD
jgi:hypothetical protein